MFARRFGCSALLPVALMPLLAFAQAPPPVASDEPEAVRNLRIIPPKRQAVSTRQQELNKRLVLQFHYEFFDLGHAREAAEKYLAADYKVNDPREPSGREAYVRFFLPKDSGGGGEGSSDMLKAMRNPANRPPIKAVLASDDLVALVFDGAVPWPKGADGKYHYVSMDLFRVAKGRIAESWFSGVPAPPAD